MKKITYLIIILLMTLVGCEIKPLKSEYVNPIIGTVTYAEQSKDIHGFGKTFPGATTPFGLVQLSPDTKTGGDNGSGYSWNHSTIEGFSFTHMSGVGWYGDLGNFLVMPTIGKLHTNKGSDENPESGYRSRFTHDQEVVEAGFYSVNLLDYNIKTELTAAPRSGMLRFTFPENKKSRIQIDLARRIGGTSTEQYVKIENENTISGWIKCSPEGGGWGNGDGNADYTLYFYCQFNKPLKNYGVWSVDIPDAWSRKNENVSSESYQELISKAKIYKGIKEFRGEHLGFFTDFHTKENEQVLMKNGISFVNIEGAKLNLESEISNWNFDQLVRKGKKKWDTALNKITVQGATEKDKEIFYTALYHTMIDPRVFSDINGNYIGVDKKIYKDKKFTYRSIFSGWDVFRSQFPLQTIINPNLVNDEINSLIRMAELKDGKYLPRWEFLNSYSKGMIGNPAVSIIVDAYEKGIRDYDVGKAFDFCKNSVDLFGNTKYGYTPNSISETLEYAYSDWCVGKFSESLGKHELANKYYKRSLNYKNIWDNNVGWFRGKNKDNEWLEWKGKTMHGQGAVESNPYQQGWFVPHDIPGLTKLMGGVDSIQNQLLYFFDKTPDNFLWNDYYNHPNEPVHNVPFIFNEIGLPRQTQKWTRRICHAAYGSDAFGLCGNEDVGQMSAWYVLAAIGIHPICPGNNKYQITSPVFNRIDIKLDNNYYNGNIFRIIAKNNSKENIYIKSIKLNGKYLDRYWITHSEITNGGVLELEMGK